MTTFEPIIVLDARLYKKSPQKLSLTDYNETEATERRAEALDDALFQQIRAATSLARRVIYADLMTEKYNAGLSRAEYAQLYGTVDASLNYRLSRRSARTLQRIDAAIALIRTL